MKFFSSFALTTCVLVAAGALTLGTSNLVARSEGAPASTQTSGQDNSAAVDATGTWQVSWTGGNGDQHQATMQIKQKGSELSGKFTGQRGSTSLKGSIMGNRVSFTLKAQRQPSFSGTLDGNKMSGTIDQAAPWSATRQQ